MNAKYGKTLERIFKNPVPANIKWRDIETMLVSLGAEIKEGSGSRVGFVLRDKRLAMHRPHPNPDTDKGAVLSVRKFLIEVGMEP